VGATYVVEELVERLSAPRAVWVMVPAGAPTQETIHRLGELLSPGDVVIGGGNSHHVDDQKHGSELAVIHFTSGNDHWPAYGH
jgi:6-phosphogluconate dehydrogenase